MMYLGKTLLALLLVFVASTFAQNKEVDSGPWPCPKVNCLTGWDIAKSQGDWYYWYSDNKFEDQGCLGCNTIQISYSTTKGKVPWFYLNSCCGVSCTHPDIADNFGFECGIRIGSGYIYPAYEDDLGLGIIKYQNLGITYTLTVLGFDDHKYLILYACITITEPGKPPSTKEVIRIFTRSRNPSADTISEIQGILGHYPFIKLQAKWKIDQGSQCNYVY